MGPAAVARTPPYRSSEADLSEEGLGGLLLLPNSALHISAIFALKERASVRTESNRQEKRQDVLVR